MEYSVAMVERMLLSFDFGNVFASIFLDTSNIEVKENSDIDESENFNTNV